MKREDGVLLQRWTRQELRLHGDRRGMRLVQWQQLNDRWRTSPVGFDGILQPAAVAALTAELRRREGGEAGK